MKRALPILMILSAATLFAAPAKKLEPPKSGAIKVAFVMNQGATMIDFAGPWEVFQDVHVESRDPMMPFELYTVAESTEPIRTSGGMRVIPDYSFANAPLPDIVVVGAQRGSPGMHDWLRKAAKDADLVMSVCTGAFKLAEAGLLEGIEATTHHDFYEQFAGAHPKVTLIRSTRYVEGGDRIATAGGLTSGIDLALRIVERYFGRDVAQQTAVYMEYESDGWKRE